MVGDLNLQHKKNNKSGFLLGILLFYVFFYVGIHEVEAAPIKILNNSNHAYSTIGNTINQLLGRPYTSSEFIIDYTTSASYSCAGGTTHFSGFDPTVAVATSTSYAYCNSSFATTTPSIPYQIFSTSFTGNPGDSVTTYNNFVTYDITDDYAFTASPTVKMPPAFYTAPGNNAFASAQGVEWKVPTTLYGGTDLSGATAANTGFMAWLRLNHSNWNWFDVKSAVRQTAANWATGYDSANYGFGLLSTTTSNALTDSQIVLQPPEIATSTSGVYSQLAFTIYPFRQTRRVKDVLFQFPTNPGFQANELTLTQIQSLGGTKVTEYTGTTATTTLPINTAVTNAYFVWFTADNSTDSSANFSRIDTYTILGPFSQSEVSFGGTFDLVSPSNNVSTTSLPMFSWNAASSYLGISKYQLFIDGVLNKDNITETSATSTTNLSDGAHTWYVKAWNGGGVATSSVSTRTINIVSNYATGYTFYVDNVLGNDNNPGTQALPWATLTKAGNTAQAGDTVMIIKNTGQPYREVLTPAYSGVSGLPITFRGFDINSKPEVWGSDDVSGGWTSYGGGNPNTYQKTLTRPTWVLAAGPTIGNLTRRVNGSSKNSLNPGEWASESTSPTYVLYYRLANGEDISTLHIEADARTYGVSSTRPYDIYKDIIVRYANTAGLYISGPGSVAQGIEVYDSYLGMNIGSSATVNYCIMARNMADGFDDLYQNNPKIYNSLFYGNDEYGGNISTLFGMNTLTFKNNISAGNGLLSFVFSYVFATPEITASNNSWDVAGDSYWNTYKGTNNQELKDPLFVDASARDFRLQQFSPNIDAGTDVGLTTDILGNPIYGTPDIGPYEYQPPYSITSSNVPIGGSFRVYKDGRYRMTTATSSALTANLAITPQGGFPSGDYSEWLNITVNAWNTSGDYSKSWTESSSSAGATVHTIGDLAPNGFYKVTVDGIDYTKFRADAGGQGTFTYSGGYSTHTFTIAQDLSVTNGPIVGSSFSSPTPLPNNEVSAFQSSSSLHTYLSSGSQPTLITSPPATSTISITTTTPPTISSTSTTTTTSNASPMVTREEIVKLQTKLVILLKELLALLIEELQNTKKTIYQ